MKKPLNFFFNLKNGVYKKSGDKIEGHGNQTICSEESKFLKNP
jgi:hypothetical protein